MAASAWALAERDKWIGWSEEIKSQRLHLVVVVLQDGSLPEVWAEAEGLRKLDTRKECTLDGPWGDRQQHFWWVSDIEYSYGKNGRQRQKPHAVVCEKSWEEVENDARIVSKTARHAWLSARPLHKKNVTTRCNFLNF